MGNQIRVGDIVDVHSTRGELLIQNATVIKIWNHQDVGKLVDLKLVSPTKKNTSGDITLTGATTLASLATTVHRNRCCCSGTCFW
jgi:hypothetical protein